MLYIKEQVGLNSYLVHDTDDNSDEVAITGDIYNCITKLNINIEGAYIDNHSNFQIVPSSITSDKKVTKLHLKTGVLLHISEDKLCGIDVTDLESSDIVINLSDYCNELSYACLSKIKSDYKLTISLSDNLKFNYDSFMTCEYSNLIIDLTNLSNEKASIAYEFFVQSIINCMTINPRVPCSVQDSNKKRLAFYRIIRALTSDNDTLRKVKMITTDSVYQSAMEEVLKVYRPKWIQIFDNNIDLNVEVPIPSITLVKPNTTTIQCILQLLSSYMIIKPDENKGDIRSLLRMMMTYCTSLEGVMDFDLAHIIFNKGKELVKRYNLC